MSPLGVCQPDEHRRVSEGGNQASAHVDPGLRESDRLDAAVGGGALTADQLPSLQPIDEECDVGRVASQALGEVTPRYRAKCGIELPQRVGEGERQVKLLERVVEVTLQGGVQPIGQLRELIVEPDRFG